MSTIRQSGLNSVVVAAFEALAVLEGRQQTSDFSKWDMTINDLWTAIDATHELLDDGEISTEQADAMAVSACEVFLATRRTA